MPFCHLLHLIRLRIGFVRQATISLSLLLFQGSSLVIAFGAWLAMKLASRYRVRRQLRPVWTFTTDIWHARHAHEATGLSSGGSLQLLMLFHNSLDIATAVADASAELDGCEIAFVSPVPKRGVAHSEFFHDFFLG